MPWKKILDENIEVLFILILMSIILALVGLINIIKTKEINKFSYINSNIIYDKECSTYELKTLIVQSGKESYEIVDNSGVAVDTEKYKLLHIISVDDENHQIKVEVK